VVGVEDRVGQIGRAALQGFGDQRGRAFVHGLDGGQGLALLGKDAPEQLDIGPGRGFVQADAQIFIPGLAQVDASGYGASRQGIGGLPGVQAQVSKAVSW
jgi:hypothetical protein